jgi:hypothetical protein
MKMKRLLVIILSILLLDCAITTKNDHNVANYLPGKKKDTPTGEVKTNCKPPRELKLTSILYELAIASEPENFAKQHDIFLSNGWVRVFIFFNPASSRPEREKIVENYKIAIEKKSKDLLRALLPINTLIPISKEPIIWSIRLPDRPIKQ